MACGAIAKKLFSNCLHFGTRNGINWRDEGARQRRDWNRKKAVAVIQLQFQRRFCRVHTNCGPFSFCLKFARLDTVCSGACRPLSTPRLHVTHNSVLWVRQQQRPIIIITVVFLCWFSFERQSCLFRMTMINASVTFFPSLSALNELPEFFRFACANSNANG